MSLDALALSALWIGTGLIELVIANGRNAALPADAPVGAGGKVIIGIVMLIVGFVIGALTVFGVLAFGLVY